MWRSLADFTICVTSKISFSLLSNFCTGLTHPRPLVNIWLAPPKLWLLQPLDLSLWSYMLSPSPLIISIDELKGLPNEWFIRHNTWWRFGKSGCKQSGFDHGGNLVVKCAGGVVVLGWVTSQEVLALHLCEHHLDPMSAKCSIYCHERWIHANHYTWNMSQWVWL